ncbi:GH1 family beta-glucosidase [Granulicella arctica]|uniref:GH1 family beta-glucosidase n=1 Tax=Granulicella arctica TaxID=940613 RepID=UPI0021E0F8C2|nr:GH1 family beta-glucosidase [Granulicella arctica]
MTTRFSRRSFAQLVGATAGAVSLPSWAAGLAQDAPKTDGNGRHFPQGFLWGSATASYQVEGAVNEEGRGPSIWDIFSHTPGKTHGGDTGDVADDHFHRYKEDIQLMKDLGLKCYRFSVAWPRVFPTGTGVANPKGLDFYNRMLDVLLAAGIEPFCTLYHWDLPQPLEDKGGWRNRDTAKAFADYAGYTAGKLSDRVKHFMTMNEIRTFTELGYGNGVHAPGLKLDKKGLAQVNHHAVLGHGLAVQAIRAKAKAGTKVGLADNLTTATPVFEVPEHIEAATKAMREENAMYLTVIQEGRYTDLYLKGLGAAAPTTTPEEMQAIGSKIDFVGINVYTASFVRADGSEKGYEMVKQPASYPHMFSEWLSIGPEALYWAPKLVGKIWNVKEMYITENGTSSADVPTAEGKILDTDRVMYLRNYLTQLQRAVSEGVPVHGYFCWSLMDNYEWADGYEKRFGIHYVDFKTQKRTPKLSAEFYKAVIARNGLA